ncbi:putative protein SYNPCC7002_B0001 [Planktothrix tepida]|uniref:DUF3854 domain-containing protein n=1 Tax=Planktothrix tepida PCC 9214 TaxID=671072 RepID=A0A1J1LW36_9CYAN|nr:plasmid replication protein, CyRepA1 family [Planktothrix tepida]CAD5976877.1 putative protein SYNPCC7002_B0001 [Planktothrix tepida]CUR35937.1 conserved hypothetical protein [Planktothrix tepida PCC 9214]
MDYLTEWTESGVDEELTQLNVIPLDGYRPLDYLLYADTLPRLNTGRLSEPILNRYKHLYDGGWWCSGIDILTGNPDLWGCFKPIKPRLTSDQSKCIKYEHPPNTPMGIFALRISRTIWERIAQKYAVEINSSDIQPHQPDLGFWRWVICHPELPLCITEGAKKAGALLTAGYIAIALPGIHGGYRVPRDQYGNRIAKPALIQQLQQFSVQNRKIYIVFDQDTKPKTIKAVNSAIQQTGYLLSQAGCSVYIVNWNPQFGKGVDDLIAEQGQTVFDQAYQTATPLETWKAFSYNRLNYSPNIDLNSRYLSDIKIHQNAKLIAIKSPKGTGKTKILETLVQEALEKKQWVLVIGHRIRLIEALCQRFGLQYMKSAVETPNSAFGYGLCIDSLHPNSSIKFEARDWSNGLVILDEVEQVLWHGLNSETCQNYRVSILKSFKTLLQNVLGGGGQVVISDADLSDTSIDYLTALSGIHLQPFVIQNQWQPSPDEAWTIYNYLGNTPDQLVKDLEQHIAEGGKPFVCLSAQKLASQWGTRTLETYLKTQFPDRSILRIDSESLADPTHPAYGSIANFNQQLISYDIVLASPSIETGVSIDIQNHFTSVWGIFQGIQAENSVRQALGRIRENIPRFIWMANRGFNQVGNGATSMSSLLGSGQRLTRLNIRLLQQSDFAGLDDLGIGFQSESLVCWAKMAVRFNAGMDHYRETILTALAGEGHQIIEVPEAKKIPKNAIKSTQKFQTKNSERPTLNELILAVKDQNYQAESLAVIHSIDLSDCQYYSLQRKLSKTPEERRAIRKYELKLRYGVAVTSDLIAKDDQGWYEQLRIHYFLTVGRPYLMGRDALIARRLMEQGQGNIFAPDFNRSQLGAMIGIMELLGIPALLKNQERDLKNTDADLQTITEIALKDRSAIKTITGIGLAKNSSPITILRRFLDKIGYRLTCVRCQSEGKKRVRVYRVIDPQDNREQIFQHWLKLEGQYPCQLDTTIPENNFISTPFQFTPDYIQLSLFNS